MKLQWIGMLGMAASLVACQSGDTAKETKAKPAEAKPTKAKPTQALIAAAEPGPVQELVAIAHKQALGEGRRLVVYVGASWCEPCQYFVKALKANDLPSQFADLRFLKFDHDADEERLEQAGYGGQMIPRFVVPARDGTATERRFEGSSKGPEAITNILPRLESILASP